MRGTAAIVLAGGSGSRLAREENKVYLQVGGRPLLAWSLSAFQRSALIDRIVLVIRPVDRSRVRGILCHTPVPKLGQIVSGGLTRHASEQAGLETLAAEIDSGEVTLVCIHDAARPFVKEDLLARVVEGARSTGGAVPGLPLPDRFLLRVSDAGTVIPVAAGTLRRMQTPQAFRAAELLQAFRAAQRTGFTGVDTAETAQRFGGLPVQVVRGDPDNLKVTYPEDLERAEELAAKLAGTSDHDG